MLIPEQFFLLDVEYNMRVICPARQDHYEVFYIEDQQDDTRSAQTRSYRSAISSIKGIMRANYAAIGQKSADRKASPPLEKSQQSFRPMSPSVRCQIKVTQLW